MTLHHRPAAACFLLLSLVLSGVQPAGADESWRWSGSFKSLDLYLAPPPASSAGRGLASSNRLRLEVQGPLTRGIKLDAALDNQLLLSDPPGHLPLAGGGVNRRLDLDRNWNADGGAADRLDVDRLNLSGDLAGVSWRLGRQAIGFGRIVIFSPLDIIAPFAPDALDTDVRTGVDALHLVHYFGLGGQVGGTVVVGDAPRHNSYLATFSENVAQVDILAIGGELRRRPVLGLGLAGSVGSLGLKGEVAGYRGSDAGHPGGDLHQHFAIAAVETWYRFEAGPVLIAEYLYNGAGAGSPENYPAAWNSAAVREGLSFLAGRHYLLLGPSWEVHPLVKLEGLAIVNLADGSCLLRPMVDLSLSDNTALQLFWSFSRGRAPRTRAPLPLPLPRSEFGSFGDSGGLFLRYYF